jgi:hypothetical protein
MPEARRSVGKFAVGLLAIAIAVVPSALVMHVILAAKAERRAALPEDHPGGTLERLTPLSESCLDASASPDGGRIAYFTLDPPFLPSHFFLLARPRAPVVPTGSAETTQRYLMVQEARGGEAEYIPLPSRRIPVGRAAWQPDGNGLLVCLSRRVDDDELREIWRIDLSDGSVTQLTYGPSESWPAVSPDGRWIAFIGNTDSQPYVMRADSSDRRRIWAEPATGATFAWSPDSRLLAFVTMSEMEQRSLFGGGGGDQLRRAVVVYRVDDDSGRPVAEPFVGRQISWSLDGSELVYTTRAYGQGAGPGGQVGSRVAAVRPDRDLTRRWLTPPMPRAITDPMAAAPGVVAFIYDDEIFCVPLAGGVPVVASIRALVNSESVARIPGAPALLFARGQPGEYDFLDFRICRFDFSAGFLARVVREGAGRER